VNATSLPAVVAAEWTKIRSVRSTAWTLLLTPALSVGIGALFALLMRVSFGSLPREEQDSFDPLFPAFYGVTVGQIALVVFGVLTMSAEYTSGTIRASLAAVPRRGLFYAGKLLAAALPIIGVSVVTVLGSFAAAQAMLGPHAVSIGGDGVPTAIVGGCLYLTLICLFATGVAATLRSSTASLAILLPVLFLGSQGFGNIPKVKTVVQYLPDQAGMLIMHLAAPAGGDPRFGRPYGPWTGLGIVALWAGAALFSGYLTLRRRDA
jgi:ABC-2 type transport system permease protein